MKLRLFVPALLSLACVVAHAEVVLLPGGDKSEWRYLDDSAPPDATWTGAKFDDAQWKSGKAPLGYGQPNLTTKLGFGADPAAKPITAYFRTTFTATGKDKLEKLAVQLRRDDGAVVYINGKEVARSNMPAGAITAKTLSATQVGPAAQEQYHLFTLPAALLAKAGADTIAVEVHQGAPGSSDLGFDLKITGYAAGEAPGGKPVAEAPVRDPFRAGVVAATEGNDEQAAKFFAQIPPTDPDYAQKMAVIGYRFYAENLGRAKAGLPFVQKAYDLAPTDKNVVEAYLKTHVLSGVLFDAKDIAREHKKTVAKEHEFLVTKPKWEKDASPKIPRAKLEEDLDYLEQVFVKCFAYLELRPVDYRGAFDAIRSSLDDETSVNAFTLRIAKLISLFCDGHARIEIKGYRNPPQYRFLPGGYAPYTAESFQGRVYLGEATGKGFLDADHPYVTAIDGKPIADWLKVAGYLVVKESPQWHLRGALHNLTFVTYLRSELGLPNAAEISLKLASEDGKATKELKVPLANRPARPAAFPHGDTRRIGDIGYLRVSKMVNKANVLEDLDEAMAKFRDTKGLILDVRGNTGGTKDIVNVLFPYFMKPGAPMRIVELSTYRLPMALPKPNPAGFGMSAMSGQAVGSAFWKTDAERQQVAEFIKSFRTEWALPAGKFSEWHAMGLSAQGNRKAYYYDKALIVLQDESTFSAGDIFVGAFEDHPNTTQIGMPTGGGNGSQESYELPNSKVGVILCQSAKFRPNGKLYDGIGIAPDIQMEATPQDVFGPTDTVLDAALKRLGGESEKTPATETPAKK